ncbi:MAG: AAA family ATPase [Lachnospiraceae bacterium]|nr:AAA family ATPase [Lachnospiraceae bacterium]
MAMIPLPYGIDLFEQVRKEHCYYIDKTHLISEMMSVPFKVNLITRPRRFGKTLAMSMLASFLISAGTAVSYSTDFRSQKMRNSAHSG